MVNKCTDFILIEILLIFKETETIVLDGDDTPKVEQLLGVPAGLPPNTVAVTGAPPPAGVPMLPQFGQPVPGKHTMYESLGNDDGEGAG